jgi:hypothetical protein
MKETTVPEFVLCQHPALPGQTARMAKPRNGWEPVAPENPSQPDGGEEDSPSAGPSNTTQDEE